MFGQKSRRIRALEEQLALGESLYDQLRKENEQIQQQHMEMREFLDSHGGQEVWDAQVILEGLRQQCEAEQKKAQLLVTETHRRVAQAEEEHQETLERLAKEEETLQEKLRPMRVQVKLEQAGFTEYPHPAKDSVERGLELRDLRKSVQMSVCNYSAVSSLDEIQVPTTKTQRNKVARDTAKLALTAFNSQVDTIITSATIRNYENSLAKIMKVADTVERLGASSGVRISPDYINQRIRELVFLFVSTKRKPSRKTLSAKDVRSFVNKREQKRSFRPKRKGSKRNANIISMC